MASFAHGVYLPVKLVAWFICWVTWRLFGVGRHGTAAGLFLAGFSFAILDAFEAAFDEMKPVLVRAVAVFLLLGAAAITAFLGQKALENTAGLTAGTRKTLANHPQITTIKLVAGVDVRLLVLRLHHGCRDRWGLAARGCPVAGSHRLPD